MTISPNPPPVTGNVNFAMSDRLRDGLTDLTPTQRAHVLGAPTLAGAVQRLLRTVHGCDSWVTDPTLAAAARMVSFDLTTALGFGGLGLAPLRDAAQGKGLLAFVDVHDAASRNWRMGYGDDPDGRADAGITSLLYGVFDSVRVANLPTADLLAHPYMAGQGRMRVRQAAVLSWWSSRRAEGHDRTSALFLLRLIADPQVFAAIEWLPSGEPGPAQSDDDSASVA